jgi:hypothetical protein
VLELCVHIEDAKFQYFNRQASLAILRATHTFSGMYGSQVMLMCVPQVHHFIRDFPYLNGDITYRSKVDRLLDDSLNSANLSLR